MYAESLKAGLLLYDQRSKLFTLWKRMQRWMTKGSTSIVIVGAGGTGKSTLGQLLACGPTGFAQPQRYRESMTVETLQLAGNVPATVLVTPGQERRRTRTLPGLLRDIASRCRLGIIHVVSHGYHSLGEEVSFRELPEYQKGMTARRFLDRYAESCRQLELDVLREIEPHLLAVKQPFWMLTLVTKQDLWWDERAAVRRVYESGSYGTLIDGIQSQRGAERFTHEYVSASLVVQNLCSGNNELLAKTTAGYDDSIQLANLTTVFDAVERFASM
jgi:hypothetical protein